MWRYVVFASRRSWWEVFLMAEVDKVLGRELRE